MAKSTKRSPAKKSIKRSPAKKSTKRSPAKKSIKRSPAKKSTKRSPAKRSVLKTKYGSQKGTIRKFTKKRQSERKQEKVQRMSRGCSKQTSSKYASRPSPPYPANNCIGSRLKGNDGRTYISKLASNGIGRWVPVA